VPARLAGVLVAVMLAVPAAAGEPRVVVEPTGTSLGATPVVVDMPPDRSLGAGEYLLAPLDTGPDLAATSYLEDGRPKLAFILDRLGPDSPRSFDVKRAAATEGHRLSTKSGKDGRLEIFSGGKLFTVFELGTNKPYLFPVIGPTGDPMTRAYPMKDIEGEERDHPHQRSFWFTHGNVNGIDFWSVDPLNSPSPRHGTIREIERRVEAAGSALAAVRTRNEWLDAAGKPILSDSRLYRFWDSGPTRWIDFDIRLTAGEDAVTFGDTKEGTFGVRVPSSMDVKRGSGGRIVNAQGITDQAAWGKPSEWVDYSGPVSGKTLGIAILNHPDSFRHPTTWHVRDYGLFAANPFGYHDFGIKTPGAHSLPSQDSIIFSYRLILHTGDAEAAQVASQYSGYASPPRARLVSP
jgi:hypothetical protein